MGRQDVKEGEEALRLGCWSWDVDVYVRRFVSGYQRRWVEPRSRQVYTDNGRAVGCCRACMSMVIQSREQDRKAGGFT